jgi:3-oxoadipate enol-lactonase
LKLYFEDSGGAGIPVVLVAGLASDAVSWIYQRFELEMSHRVIVCDNRGVARSPKPPGPYRISEMAEDVLELIDGLGLKKVSLVGHSMGGAICQHLAVRHSERVHRLVLACTQASFSGRVRAIVESWAGCLALGADTDLLGRCLFPWLYTQAFLDRPGYLEACLAGLRNHPYPLDAAGVAGQVAALVEFDLRAQLNSIAAPTLVLAADQDLLSPPDSCRELLTAIPGARWRLLPDTGHSCMLQTPELFNQALLEFL